MSYHDTDRCITLGEHRVTQRHPHTECPAEPRTLDLPGIVAARTSPAGIVVAEAVINQATFVLVAHRDAALALPQTETDELNDFEGELNDAHREAVLDVYHDVARALGILDEESSASSQHFIDTGARLLYGEAITS